MVCASLEKSSWLNGLRWPSPDLNPVKHLWDAVERLTGSMNMQLTNLHKWCDESCQQADFWRKVSKISSRTQENAASVMLFLIKRSVSVNSQVWTALGISCCVMILSYIWLEWEPSVGWSVNFLVSRRCSSESIWAQWMVAGFAIKSSVLKELLAMKNVWPPFRKQNIFWAVNWSSCVLLAFTPAMLFFLPKYSWGAEVYSCMRWESLSGRI